MRSEIVFVATAVEFSDWNSMPSANSAPASAPRAWWLLPAVVLLLAVHWLLAVASKVNESTTSDELVHVTGGYTYWKFNDYRIQPENGNLPQRWAALPAMLMGTKFPEIEGNPYWRTSDAWVLGHEFFYETGDDHFPRLMGARAMIALFSVATGVLVFMWSRRLFGDAGGFVSLAFYAFSPTFLAHGALATSDACMTFFFLASVGAYWRHLHDPRPRWWWLSALTFGLACVAKFNAVLLLPMMLAMALVRASHPAPCRLVGRSAATWVGKVGAITLSTVGHGLVALLVIWAFFGFRYSAFNPALPAADHFIRPWEITLSHIGRQADIIRAFSAIHALPEGFLYGFSFVLEMSQYRAAFLDGAYSLTGWVRFFPLAFLYKSTLPVLLAGVALVATAGKSLWRAGSQRRVGTVLYRFVPLIALFVIYWAVSLRIHLNIGHRHIMPTYPVLFIMFGVLARWCTRARPGATLIVIGLCAWQAVEAVRVYPDYIAYFNPAAGGMRHGHRHLVDSSVDWGQDLPGLKAWLDQNAHAEPVYLSYAGSGEPLYYGITARRLPFVDGFKIERPYVPLQPGVYCIGASMLEHVYSPVRGPWTPALEKEFQKLRELEPAFFAYTYDPVQRAALQREGTPERWHFLWSRYDVLRFARLSYYLRERKPDAQVGYSIFIYRLTAEEIAATTAGSLDEWNAALARAAARRW